MQHITYRVKQGIKTLTNQLSLKPSQETPKTSCDIPSKTPSNLTHSLWFVRTKKIIQISSIALLSLPAKSLIQTQSDVASYDKVMMQKTLTIASVSGDSTYFATDGFQHGFGYDLARSYADQLGVNIDLKAYPNDMAALQAVKSGQADMALTTASTKTKSQLELASLNLSCGHDAKLTKNGLHPKVSWVFAHADDKLAQTASHFLCDAQQIQKTSKLARFYNQNLLKDAYNQQHFEKIMNERLPNYKRLFQQQANYYNHDWQLLVAMGYQESHLDANASSPTGVQGLMMLTNSTAEAMGVADRIDPSQSISGGARYLEKMKSEFSDVPNPDRLWFALASYNMGPNAIKNIQRQLKNSGKDEKSWANVYAYLADNAATNSRYVQCMHYVSNIRSYLEKIKTQTV